MLLQNLVPVDSDKIVRATYAEGKKICLPVVVYVVVRRVSLPTYEYSDLFRTPYFRFLPPPPGGAQKTKTRFIVGMVGQRVLEKILGGRRIWGLYVCIFQSKAPLLRTTTTTTLL